MTMTWRLISDQRRPAQTRALLSCRSRAVTRSKRPPEWSYEKASNHSRPLQMSRLYPRGQRPAQRGTRQSTVCFIILNWLQVLLIFLRYYHS